MARKINSRNQKKPLNRVVGAGITEYWYLKHLKPILGLRFEMYPRMFGNESMSTINKRIDEGLKDGAKVICLFDEDVKRWDNKEAGRMKALHEKYGNDERVVLGCSMPSIEYWFLLHYENTNRFLKTSGDAMTVLNKYIPQFDKKESFLKNKKWVVELIKDNKMNVAKDRAKSLDRSGDASYTDVWKAIDAME